MRHGSACAGTPCVALLVVTLLGGRVLDRTTGQPLPDVRVSTTGASTLTDKNGHYALRGLTPGSYTLTLQSNDVPAYRVRVTLKSGRNERDIRACSTTLDYGCGEAPAPGGAG
jgi:protocatechuate 3,4-dioxygenase beta subunit